MNTFSKTVTLCLVISLAVVPWVHAESNLDIKAGNFTDNKGPIIIGKDNKVGLDEKAMEKKLKGMEKRLINTIKEQKANPTQADPFVIQILVKELSAVQSKLANTEQALKDHKEVLVETKQALESEKLKNVAPADQLQAAQEKLNQGDTSKAEAVFEEIIKRAEPHLEASAEAAFRLGKLAYERVDYRAAQKYYEKAAQLSPDNPIYLNEVGIVAHYLAQYDKANEYFEKSLASLLNTYGLDHPSEASLWNNLGAVWNARGDYDKAIEFYENSLASNINTFGPEHLSVAKNWNNLGETWRANGQTDRSIEYYEKALKVYLKTLGKEHPNIAILWNNLGVAWGSKGDYDKAINYYEKALKSDLKFFGPKHRSVARDWNNLGVAWRVKGQYNKAMQHYKKALAVYKMADLDHLARVVEGNIQALKNQR